MIEIVTWISNTYELDLGDVLYFAEQAVIPGTKVIFVSDEDIAGALAVQVGGTPTPPKQDVLDDEDEFGHYDEIHQGVVLYRGEGSEEEIAAAYVQAWRGQ
jgi:hypothetical protein